MFCAWPGAHVKMKAEKYNLALASKVFSAYHSCYHNFQEVGNFRTVLYTAA